MYDRAERNLVVTYGSTPSNVGPGSYDALVGHKSNLKAGKKYNNKKMIYIYIYTVDPEINAIILLM